MQSNLLYISDGVKDNILSDLEINLSFNKFTDYLKKRIAEEDSVKKSFFQLALDKFNSTNQTGAQILDDPRKYSEELSLIYNMLVPIMNNETELLWAICLPLTPVVFYGTDAFYDLLTDREACSFHQEVMVNGEGEDDIYHKKLKMVYSFILQQFYGIGSPVKNELSISFDDHKTGLQKYYKINIDTRFVEVSSKKPLPELSIEDLQRQMTEGIDVPFMLKVLPLSNFKIDGFSVISMTDMTQSHALDAIKTIIINRNNYEDHRYYEDVVRSLKVLAGSSQIEFGVMSALRVNNKPVFDQEAVKNSIMLRLAIENGLDEDTFLTWADGYYRNPVSIFYEVLPEDDEKSDFFTKLKINGVKAYALLPVFYNNKLTGILEVYTKENDTLTNKILSNIEVATPLVAQLLQNNIDEFNAKIENLIKEKFTPLQPAVEWKFNKAAWEYLRQIEDSRQKPVMGKVLFKNVYPLYGAIDIRNSTIERNKALSSDLKRQFEILVEVLGWLNEKVNITIIDELIFKCRQWILSINDVTASLDQNKINHFLEYEVNPVLAHFKENEPDHAAILRIYFDAIDEEHGAAYTNRRALESSIQAINFSISQYLEFMKEEMEQSYPCYFEKFRTDGIEYDIYIGQSIAPGKRFSSLYLKNMRLLQLASMANIARITNALLPELEKPLLTTQLIFIHSADIDISFRNDERRFDVEGSYNIRYQIVKKRIDKVLIKGTGERLTQPGKIALIYFTDEEAKEYVEYLSYLHEQNILENNPEFLDLDDVQGVHGLKALRVGVQF